MKTNICAKSIDSELDIPEKICTAADGSPLVIDNTIIGIFHEHPEGCKQGFQYYTRITSFRSNFVELLLNGHTSVSIRNGIFKDDGSFEETGDIKYNIDAPVYFSDGK